MIRCPCGLAFPPGQGILATVLTLENLSVNGRRHEPPILHGVNIEFEPGRMHAVVGPSGSGKTTLARALVGLAPVSEGMCRWGAHELRTLDDRVGRLGYVPQFCQARPEFTVEETVRQTIAWIDLAEERRAERLEHILQSVGLQPLRAQKVGSLSGGQLRRLALALALGADPQVLLCDEVTAGLDPGSENAILDLVSDLVAREGKTSINIIHNLHQLHRFPSVTVLQDGQVVFHGSRRDCLRFFELQDPHALFDVLQQKSPGEWQQRYSGFVREDQPGEELPPDGPAGQPALVASRTVLQLRHLLARRWSQLWRDKGVLALLAAITVGFPLLVVLFALNGLPAMEKFGLAQPRGLFEQMRGEIAFALESSRVGALVSGLVMFQVILLTLTGINNGAREIAAERNLFLQESLRGLHPWAYCWEKLTFTATLAVIQGVVMLVIVKTVCGFPGSWLGQGLALILVSLSLTWIALAFSAWMSSPEKASLLAVYVVGFQLPMSGIFLSLPEPLTEPVRFFISAYWGWAAYVSAFRLTDFYDAIVFLTEERVPDTLRALAFLAAHSLLGAALAIAGVFHLRAGGARDSS